MMERCPTCRARLKGAVICPRCQTDLGRVLKITERAKFLCQYAIARLQQQDVQPAVWAIREALQLQRSPLCLSLQHFLVRQLERQAVTFLGNGQWQRAAESIELALSLKRTPFALALQAFIRQQKQGSQTTNR